MIPRYAPSYTYSDVFRSLGKSIHNRANDDLKTHLKALYKVNHVFVLSSAKAALYALLKAYNRPGKVLMPAYNSRVVPEVVHFAGYSPAFVDIDYQTLNMSHEMLDAALGTGVTAVVIVHLFGIPCNMEDIERIRHRKDILIIEDAAPALGAEYDGRLVGSFGDAAIVSFQATKVISGETGGILLVNDDELAQKVEHVLQAADPPGSNWLIFAKAIARKTAFHPWLYPTIKIGYRSLHKEQLFEVVEPRTTIPPKFLRLCSKYSSTLISVQLDRLDWHLQRRRYLAQTYRESLSDCVPVRLPQIPSQCAPAWIQFPILVEDKESFYWYMQGLGVDLNWTFRYSCADSYRLNGFPNAQKAAKTLLGLPTYPSLTDKNARYICDAIKKYCTTRI